MFLRKTKCRNDEKSGRRRKSSCCVRCLFPACCTLSDSSFWDSCFIIMPCSPKNSRPRLKSSWKQQRQRCRQKLYQRSKNRILHHLSSRKRRSLRHLSPRNLLNLSKVLSKVSRHRPRSLQKRQNRLRQKINRPRMQKYRNLLKLPTRPSPQHHHRCPLTRRRRRLRMWKAAFRCRQGRPLLQPRAVRLRPQRLALEKDRRQVLPARRTAAAVTMALQLLPAVLPILRILLLAPAVRKATPTSPRVLPPASRPIKNIRILPSALAKQAA